MEYGFVLEVLGGPMDGLRLNLSKEMTTTRIGRQVGNNLTLPFDMTISRWHATIRKEGLDHYLIDEHSVSGTYLDGKRIKKIKIEPGMIFLVGGTIIEVTGQPLADKNVVIENKYFENPAIVYRFSDQLKGVWESLYSGENEKKYGSITGFFQQPAFYRIKNLASYRCIQQLCRFDSRKIVSDWIDRCGIKPKYWFIQENVYLTAPRMWHVLDMASHGNTKKIGFYDFIQAVLNEKKSLAARILLKDDVFIWNFKNRFHKKEIQKKTVSHPKTDPVQDLLLSSLRKFETIISGFIEDAINAGISRGRPAIKMSKLTIAADPEKTDQTVLRNQLKTLEKNLVAILAAHRDSLRLFEKELGNRISAVLNQDKSKGLFPLPDSDDRVSKAVRSILKESELEGLSDRIVRQTIKKKIIP